MSGKLQAQGLLGMVSSVTLGAMKNDSIHRILSILREECSQWGMPAVSAIAEQERSPFTILVSCIISLRTKDAVTAAASARLFERAREPSAMVLLHEEEIASLIYPAGFYRTKARQIREISRRLLNEFADRVPDELDTLLTLRGVGRKTANLVITLGYGKPGICVDTHVHRITNRWGYVVTKAPDQTEAALRSRLPPEYWIEINDLLVCYGQNICLPVSPICSTCRLAPWCKRVGVVRNR